jgi:hypothetical protein
MHFLHAQHGKRCMPRYHKRMPRKSRRTIAIAALVVALLSTLTTGFVVTGITPSMVLEKGTSRSPSALIRYTLQRLEGHGFLERVFVPFISLAQQYYERPTDGTPLPALGKGQQTALPKLPLHTASLQVYSSVEFQQALLAAKPGDVIALAPGLHRINQKLRIGAAGKSGAPITVRGAAMGARGSVIEFNTTEGFLVNQPHWVFENLTIRGVCRSDKDCEHAFHIVGKAEHIILRNNHIEDFNAHIKVNGLAGDWPDHGTLTHNTITNTRPRDTGNPVTPFDLVGANFWTLTDNLVSNFVKVQGNKISFGIFMKGASEGGRIERNLVVCSPSAISGPGMRVGISFGGGGTDPHACRDGKCQAYEHNGGLAANNIIAHCNDSGLDVNHSSQITLAHNTLINTSGIDLRLGPANAHIYANLYEGSIRSRNGSQARIDMDERMKARTVFEDPDRLNLAWLVAPEKIPSLRGVPADFCGQKRGDGTPPGALVDWQRCEPQLLNALILPPGQSGSLRRTPSQ